MRYRIAIAGLAAAALAGAVAWRCRGRAADRAPPAADDRASDRRAGPADLAGGAAGPAGRAADAPPRPGRVVRIASAEARLRLVERIHAAQAARAARARRAAPPAPPPPTDLDHVAEPVKDALEDAIPYLADCYQGAAPTDRPAVQMTLIGDPSVGTVIDVDQLVDQDQRPLAPALETCLRDTLRSLELPPLEEGDSLHVQYSFRFDDPDAGRP